MPNLPNHTYFVHLLNDYSGSPKILRQVAQSYPGKNTVLCSNSEGFLSDLPHKQTIPYTYSKYKIITLFYFLKAQAYLFWFLIKHAQKTDLIYINTLLPFSAALAGKLKGAKVLYHIHEVSLHSALKSTLVYMAKKTASHFIFVSDYVQNHYAHLKPFSRIYNALDDHFIAQSQKSKTQTNASFNVLMLCSFKPYKGIYQFVRVAKSLKNITFHLVLNADTQKIAAFKAQYRAVKNLKIYPKQKDVHRFYKQANLVVNLSLPSAWIETFGLTALEAMAYGTPVIVPPVGGIAEISPNKSVGYHIHPKHINTLSQTIKHLACNKTLYDDLSRRAYAHSTLFSSSVFQSQMQQTITSLFSKRESLSKNKTNKDSLKPKLTENEIVMKTA